MPAHGGLVMDRCKRASAHLVWIAIACVTLAGCATSPPTAQTPPPGAQVAELPAPHEGDWWEFVPAPAHPIECKGRLQYQGVKDGSYVFACPNMSYYYDSTYNFVKA